MDLFPAFLRVKAKKTLVNDIGRYDFVKGKEYSVVSASGGKLTEYTVVWDEFNDEHRLGNWVKHFKVVR